MSKSVDLRTYDILFLLESILQKFDQNQRIYSRLMLFSIHSVAVEDKCNFSNT